MAHELDMSTGRAAIAFMGARADIWHGHGQQMQPGMSTAEWAKAAGLAWQAIKVPALAALDGAAFDHIAPGDRFAPVDNCKFVARSDTGAVLGVVSDRYQPVQPRDVLDWFERYISVSDQFQLDVAGALKGGATIWATATFRDSLAIAGDKHTARVLMTTTFDGSGATVNQGTMTRVVCNNTLAVATADKRAVVRTTHATNFDPARVGKELATIAKGFANYKAIGDALAQAEMAKEEVSAFFKQCLDIPLEAKRDDVSARKANQFQAVVKAYSVSQQEGAEGAWAALNAITRYVDHGRVSDDDARFASAQFGSGAALKDKAMGLLMPRVADRVLIAA